MLMFCRLSGDLRTAIGTASFYGSICIATLPQVLFTLYDLSSTKLILTLVFIMLVIWFAFAIVVIMVFICIK